MFEYKTDRFLPERNIEEKKLNRIIKESNLFDTLFVLLLWNIIIIVSYITFSVLHYNFVDSTLNNIAINFFIFDLIINCVYLIKNVYRNIIIKKIANIFIIIDIIPGLVIIYLSVTNFDKYNTISLSIISIKVLISLLLLIV